MTRRLALTTCLLFVSGACALVFQVAWLREFRLVFGATTAASAAVTAIFMGGLGLGSAILGKRADAQANPLRLYALLELTIALSAAVSPWLIDGIQWFYIAVGGQTTLGIAGASIVRLLLSTLVLGLPTCAMGGTLPAAVRAVTTPQDRCRNRAAILYGVNTLGAVLGASLSTFLLLPHLGTRTTLWLAVAVNVCLAACAWAISRVPASPFESQQSHANDKQVKTSARQELSTLTTNPAFVYTAAAIVGFCFFLMELVWYRMLGPILGGTTFTFGLILVVALLGIGLGGAAYALLSRYLTPSLIGFATTCGVEAACIALPFAAGDRLAVLAAQYHEMGGGFAGQVYGWAIVAGLAIFPAAFVSGIQFPLLVALAGRAEKDVGKQVGFTLACNTSGAILGSLTGGFGLLPLLTAPGAWIAVVLLLTALALGTILLTMRQSNTAQQGNTAQPRNTRRQSNGQMGRAGALVPLGAAAVAALCLWTTGPTAAWRHSGIGAGRFQLPSDQPNDLRRWANAARQDVIWEAEGVEASIALVANDGLSFFVNGKSDGNATGDAGTQIMLGMLPAILHPEPKTALVVGLGTGETPGWLAEVPSIERVDVAELEPAVDEMARRCAAVNHNALRHPKVHRIYNDAREILLTTRQSYDIIASEPSNPYRAGIANLFTREYYLACRERLNEQGLFVQWLQGYEIDEQTVRTVLATLDHVFEHVEVWQSKSEDTLLVCSCRPMQYSAEALRERISQEPFRSALACGWRVVDLEGFFCRFIGGPELAADYAQQESGRLNTDDHNLVEYGFARTVGQEATGFSIEGLRERAVALNAQFPQLDHADDICWDRVEGHRQLLYALTNRIVLPANPSPEHTARSEVLRRYWAADMKGMTDAWETAGYEPIFPSEVALLGLGYADQADDKALKFIDKLETFQPVEADAIAAYLAVKQGNPTRAASLLKRVFRELRTNPWGLSHTLQLCFKAAVPVVQSIPTQAEPMYRALREPFAVYAYEGMRRSTALNVARFVGRDALVETLTTFEPNVPWDESFLTFRLRAYENLKHPLRNRAEEDLNRYRQQIEVNRPATASLSP